MDIIRYQHTDAGAWNDFVAAVPEGSFFHRAEWHSILEKVFGFETHYMIAKNHEGIQGVMPLAYVNRFPFGSALISSPLGVYGGAIGQRRGLIEAACLKAEALNVEYLEMRHEVSEEYLSCHSDLFYTFQRNISDEPEKNLLSIPRKQRAEVRKGMEAGFVCVFNQDVDLFYKIYARSVRDLGTPIFSKKYLSTLIDTFGDACEIATIMKEGRALTSVLSFVHKDRIMPYYGGGLPSARHTPAYPYMYWKVMQRAAEKGLKVFDFGRSMKNSGAYAFKKNFGFEPTPLHYGYHLVNAAEMPDMNPHHIRNKILTKIWSQIPMPLANIIGPRVYPIIV